MRLKVKPEPNFFDKKTIIEFAWIPIRVENNIIWLEKYERTYRYTKDSVWEYYYWEEIDKKLINKKD
jgi:hypothetical protein